MANVVSNQIAFPNVLVTQPADNPSQNGATPLVVRTAQTGAPGLTGTGFRPATGQVYTRGVR